MFRIGCLFVDRKEEGMSVEPTFSVSVIFGKRDEVKLFYLIMVYIANTYPKSY